MNIDNIITELEALEDGDNVKRKTLETVMVSVLLDNEKVEHWNRAFPFGRITIDLSRARELFLRAFPGWCYRVAECSVSDDAWVIPDFNHPDHGPALQKRFPDALRDPVEWFGTDVDLRPSGNPALALCISMLLAKKKTIEVEEALAERRHKPVADLTLVDVTKLGDAKPVFIGVDLSSSDDFSVEWVSIPKEEYDALKRREQDLLEANNRYLARARLAEGEERNVRDARQAAIMAWAHKAFGGIEGFDPCTIQERARRLLEEVLELIQAVDVGADECAKVLAYVYSRPKGEPFQEAGGVALTFACLAEVLKISICEAEVAEFDRVQSKSRAHFEARHRAKMEVGL